MSLNKSATRRRSLLAGSSLGLAVIASTASIGMTLAPSAAFAQATCTSGTSITNNVSNNVIIAAGNPNNPGITCTYVGDDALVSTAAGATVVSTVAPGGGVNLAAAADDSINWNSSAGNLTGNIETNGPVIHATTQTGDIGLIVGNVVGSAATVTEGIRAISSGFGGLPGGDISILNGTANAAVSVTGTNATSGNAGIYASTAGGNITIGSSASRVTGNGRLYGIFAETSGAGGINIYASSASTNTTAGLAAIYAKSGTGLLNISVNNAITGAAGNAIRTVAGGNASINVTGILRSDGLSEYTLDATTAAGGRTTVTNTGRIQGGSSQVSLGLPTNLGAIRSRGAGELVIQNSGEIRGRIDFGNASGATQMNILSGGAWYTAEQNLFGSGGDALNVSSSGLFAATYFSQDGNGQPLTPAPGAGDPAAVETITLDFGAGEDSFSNAGLILIGPRPHVLTSVNPDLTDRLEAEFYLLGLETFENSGTIQFGTFRNYTGGADLIADDILSAPGTNFIGSGDSLIVLDVNLNGSGQTACDPALRDPVTFDMPAADCLSFTGGSTAGVTRVQVNDMFSGDRGAFDPNGIVIVDVSGGTGAQGDFVIDPTSPNYSSALGGVIDKGSFFYPLLWNPDTQQHMLVSTPSTASRQYPLIAQAVHGVWRASTGTWLDRQADLRDEDSPGGGVWLRGTTEFTDRDLTQRDEVGGVTLEFDNTYAESTYAVTTGVDLITGGTQAMAWVLGAMGGYTHSELDFENAATRAQLDGYVGGVYGGLIAGGFFLDAVVNTNKLILDHDVPNLNLLPVGAITSTDLITYGAQVEAGWRFPLMESAFVEPLASVSYVRATFDDLAIVPYDASRPGVDVQWDDPVSLRASLGGRFGLDQSYGAWRAQYSVLGRVWNEFEDETNVVLKNLGQDALVVSEYSGTLSEFGVGLNLYGLNDAFSGFFNFGGKFGEDYKSQNLSAGVRVNW